MTQVISAADALSIVEAASQSNTEPIRAHAGRLLASLNSNDNWWVNAGIHVYRNDPNQASRFQGMKRFNIKFGRHAGGEHYHCWMTIADPASNHGTDSGGLSLRLPVGPAGQLVERYIVLCAIDLQQ